MSVVRRLARLMLWVLVAGGAFAMFVWSGRFAPLPFRLSDPSRWLREVERDDAFVEVARLFGVLVSGYVCVSALLALFAEVAAAARLVSLARMLSRVGRLVAVPVLRQRLWRSVSGVTLSASTMVMATSGSAVAVPSAPTEQSVDGPTVGDVLELPGDLVGAFSGFGLEGAIVQPAPTAGSAPATTAAVVERVVVDGDTVWALADEVYGHVDATVIEHVAKANGLADPSLILVGQHLVFPPLPPPVAPPVATGGGASWSVHTVVAGDTLWEVLEAHYGWVTGDLVWHVAEVNQLADPSQIAIGAVVTLPGLEGEAEVPTPAPPTVETPPLPASEPAAPLPRPAPTTAPPPTTPPTTVPVPQSPPATEPSLAPTTLAVTETVANTPLDPDPVSDTPIPVEATDDVELFDQSTRTMWWQVPMGLLLAAGMVEMVRRLRGRRATQLRPGEQLGPPTPAAAGTELAVRSAAPAERVSTLHALLRSVTPHARAQHDPPPVRVVEVAEDRLEILFAGAAPFPPDGFSTVNGGRSWVHELIGEVSCPVRQLLTPALVTLGRRSGGGEVLLDLETAGSLAITGERDAAVGVARSMVLELATYPLGVPIDVALVGLDVAGVEFCDRVWPNTTLTRAVRVARDTVERTASRGTGSLVAVRAATDDDTGELDPQVFVVDLASIADAERSTLDELVGVCQPNCGAAVIIIGEHPQATETLQLLSAEQATWSGAQLVPPVVTGEAAGQAAEMFDYLANAPAEPMSVSPAIADTLDLRFDTIIDDVPHDCLNGTRAQPLAHDDESDVVEFAYEPPPFDVLVRCLGEVTVEGRPIIQSAEVELLALLTLQRDVRPNIDTIYTLLVDDPFGGRSKRPIPREPLRPMQQRVSRLRVKLGTDTDGNDLLPAAKPGRGSPSRYTVSERVLTDVELLEHRYHTSLELSSEEAFDLLRDGLATFRGPMLRAKKGYSWAATEGITSRIGTFVIAYAVRLMELAFERNDIPVVLETVRCCGIVLDDPLVELQAWQRIDDLAEATAHPDLVAAVREARRRLATYVEVTDPVADARI